MPEENEPQTDWSSFEQEFQGKDAPPMQILTEDMIRRRLLWDIVPCDMAAVIIKRLGLPEVSAEVEATEHGESHLRMSTSGALAPAIYNMAAYSADIILEGTAEKYGLDRDLEQEKTTLTNAIHQSTWAIIAEFLDVGWIHFPHYVVATEPPEVPG